MMNNKYITFVFTKAEKWELPVPFVRTRKCDKCECGTDTQPCWAYDTEIKANLRPVYHVCTSCLSNQLKKV